MALDGGNVFADNVGERIQGHITNIIVSIKKESTKNVYRQNLEARFRLDRHDCLDAFVENGITGIPGCLGVGSNLGQAEFTRKIILKRSRWILK